MMVPCAFKLGMVYLLTFFFWPVAVVWLGESWIRGNLQKWLEDVRAASFALEQDAIVTATLGKHPYGSSHACICPGIVNSEPPPPTFLARAAFGQEVIDRFMRDLHLYTRTAGWLLFGALQRSEAFTYMRSGAEGCKEYEEKSQCPFKDTQVTWYVRQCVIFWFLRS